MDFKKIRSRVVAIVMLCVLVFSSSVFALEGTRKDEAFYISGTISSIQEKKITLIAVKKDSDVYNLNGDDVAYMEQITLSEGGEYSFRFKSRYQLSELDVYVNDGKKQYVDIKDFEGDVSISTNISPETLIENLEYNVNVEMDDIFGYDSDIYHVVIACYKDNRLLKVSIDSSIFNASINKNFKLVVPEGTTMAKIMVWKFDTLKGFGKEEVTIENTLEEIKDYNLNTTFIGDPKTQRGFAWEASSEFDNMVLQYGTDENNLTEEVAGVKAEEKLLINEKAIDISSNFYKADLINLLPGTTYYYRIGDTEHQYFSKIHSFTTEEENNEEFSVLAFTDPQGTTTGHYTHYKKCIDTAVSENPDVDFIFNVGDMVDIGYYDDIWDMYFKTMSGKKEKLPVQTVVGNHEALFHEQTGTPGIIYYNLRFNNPQNAKGLSDGYTPSTTNTWSKPLFENIDNTVYSFDYGNTHFAVLNSGTDKDPNGMVEFMNLQTEWLRNDLNSSDKKWKVVLIHRGLYCAQDRDDGPKEVFLDVIDECGVDLVLQGHDHSYLRTYQMKGDVAVDTNLDSVTQGVGTVYSVVGGSGVKRYTPSETLPSFAAVSVEVPSNTPSYTLINFKNDKIEFIEKTTDGTVLDSFDIIAK